MNNIKSDEQEKWLSVPLAEYAAAYEISTMGRIRGINRIAASETFIRKIRGVVLKGRIRRDGYKTVNLSYLRNRAQFSIHQLVALAFIPNPKRLPQAIHKNGDKLDNRVSNLMWGTISDRNDLSVTSGRNKSAGADNAQFKGLVVAKNIKTGEDKVLCGKKEIITAGFDHSAVYSCLNGRIKSHRGYKFSRTQGENA
ncbi:NUMOD4 motif-containing HNH endonuclease [Serratia sp. JSRIV002]|uniref:NUMOD4 domain-containing protein n=1 Tax=Serratia sp. JSRIV002 TaxID=2831894 RepID=UPI001CBF9FF2|nr:NUMOD4 domain-containing protein [Serratia sp. JSRIV002]UAN49943.1 NUMOD4 motif-containing HNH endonuclease [Serratia sp. JSRIV002]